MNGPEPEYEDEGDTGSGRELLAAAERLGGLGSWDWRPCAGRLKWSDNLFRIYGLEPGEIVPSSEYVLEHIHPEDRERVASAVGHIRTEGELASFDYRFVRPDGAVRDMRATTAVVEERDGRPWRAIGCVQDLTDQLRAERAIAGRVAVSEALAQWGSFEEGGTRLLADTAAAMGFDVGALWARQDRVLALRLFWSREEIEGSEFAAITRQMRLPLGGGLPGRAWERRRPVSLSEAPDTALPRRDAIHEAGLRGGIAVPAVQGAETIAVLEFYSRDDIVVTERLTEVLTAIGFEIGVFLARRRGELAKPLLSPREVEILQLAAQGHSGPEIAERLVVSPSTVKTHFEHIFEKLDVRDRAAAVATGLRLGAID